MVGLTLAGAETTATADHVLRSSPPLELHGDEAEGYLQNVLADEPSIFFLLRPDEAAEAAAKRSPLVAAVSRVFTGGALAPTAAPRSNACRCLQAGRKPSKATVGPTQAARRETPEASLRRQWRQA